MDFAQAVALASQPLHPIQTALAQVGVPMVIAQTGGFCMVGYVGPQDGPHVGVTREDITADAYLVCGYTGDDDDCGTTLHDARYVPMAAAVALVTDYVTAGA